MAPAIDADSSAPAAKTTTIVCDVCRKHAGVHTPDASPYKSAQKHPSAFILQQAAGNFDCNICLDGCHDPVVTLCGHLFCWPCLFYWLSLHSLPQECPVCKANVQGKIIPLYGPGKAEHSANSTAAMFPNLHIPCRPSQSGFDAPITATTGTDRDGALLNGAIQGYEMHTRFAAPYIANVGFFASMLRSCMTSCIPQSGGFFFGWVRNRTWIMEQRRRRFRNKKEFFLHWGFIIVASMAIVCFIVN